jgi:hypothetical protein
MEGFADLSRAAARDGALDKKTKELIAIAPRIRALSHAIRARRLDSMPARQRSDAGSHFPGSDGPFEK